MSKRKISVLKGSSGSIRSLHMTPSGMFILKYLISLHCFFEVFDIFSAHIDCIQQF